MRIARTVVAMLAVVAVAGVAEAIPVQWSSGAGGNDHWYEFVAGGITWSAADTAATAMTHLGSPGYLATVTSAEEHDFVVALFSGDLGASFLGPWLGGFQPPDQSSPDAGFQWVTGEAWSYTNFRLGVTECFGPEPNDGDCAASPPVEDNEENHLHIYQVTGFPWLWNDAPEGMAMPGYIVEFNPSQTAVPEPSSFTLLGMALLLGIGGERLRRGRRPGRPS